MNCALSHENMELEGSQNLLQSDPFFHIHLSDYWVWRGLVKDLVSTEAACELATQNSLPGGRSLVCLCLLHVVELKL